MEASLITVPEITVPEAVAFYWGDPVNAAAINILTGEGVPPDLTLAEAERFEVASLAARRVRLEHWRLLRALWGATWGAAVRVGLPGARLLTYTEHQAFVAEANEPYADPSAAYAWENGDTAGVFEVPGHGHLFTSLGLIEPRREVELRLYVWSSAAGTAVSDGLDLGAEWGSDDDGRRVLRTETGGFKSAAGVMDVEPVAMLARAAITDLAAGLS